MIAANVRKLHNLTGNSRVDVCDEVIQDISFIMDKICTTENDNDDKNKNVDFANFYVRNCLNYDHVNLRYGSIKPYTLCKVNNYRMFAYHARGSHVHGSKRPPLKNALCFAVCAFAIAKEMRKWIRGGCRKNDDEAYNIIHNIYGTCNKLKNELFGDETTFPQYGRVKYLSLYCRVAVRAENDFAKDNYNDKHCDRTYVWNVLFDHGNDDIAAVWDPDEIERRIQTYLVDLRTPAPPSHVVKDTAPVASSPSLSASVNKVSYRESSNRSQPQNAPVPTSVSGNINTTPPFLPPRVLQQQPQQQSQVPYVGGTPTVNVNNQPPPSAAPSSAWNSNLPTSFPCFTHPAMQQNTWVPPVPAPAPAAMPVPSFHYPFSFMAGPPPPTMIVKANICVVMEVLMQALIIHPNGDRKYVEPYSYDIWVVLVRTLLRTDVSSHTVAQEIQGILTRCGSMVWNMNGIISEITKKRVSQDVSTAFASFAHVVLTNHNNALALTQSIEDCRRALFQA